MSNPTLIKSYRAESDIGDYTLCTHGSVDKAAVPASGPTNALIGTTHALGAAAGNMVDVQMGGQLEVRLGGAVSAGDPLTSDANGAAVVAVMGNRIVGFANVGGVAGDVITYNHALGIMP